jgi:hypothetical protein
MAFHCIKAPELGSSLVVGAPSPVLPTTTLAKRSSFSATTLSPIKPPPVLPEKCDFSKIQLVNQLCHGIDMKQVGVGIHRHGLVGAPEANQVGHNRPITRCV